MAGRAEHGPLAQIVRLLGMREQSVREPDSVAGEAERVLRGPAGPRTLGLGGQSLRAEALDERRLWQHVLDVLALSLWTEQLAQTRSRSEQVTALLLAARDRVDREEKWLKARTGEPIATVRARLAEIAVARSFARQDADAAADGLRRELRAAEAQGRASGDRVDERQDAELTTRFARERLSRAEIASETARPAHRLAILAALTAGATNRDLEAMALDTGASSLRKLRESGATSLAAQAEKVTHLDKPVDPAIAIGAPPPGRTPIEPVKTAGRLERRLPALVRRRVPLLVAAGLLLVAVVVLLLIPGARTGSSTAGGGARDCPAALTSIDPADQQVAIAHDIPGPSRALSPIHLGPRPASLAVGREGVWVAERQGVVLIDPQRRAQAFSVIPVTDEPPSPHNAPFSIAISSSRLWVARRDGWLVSIDRATHERVGPAVRFGEGAGTVALAGGAVWVNNYKDRYEGDLTWVDPCRGTVHRVPVGREANSVYAAFGSLWATNSVDGSVEQIDPKSKVKIASIGGLDDPEDIIAAHGALWVTQYATRTLQRIDPVTRQKVGRPIRIGADPAGIAEGADALWVALYGNGTLTRVDLTKVTPQQAAAKAGQSPTDVVAGFGRLWAPNNDGDTVTPVQP